MDKDILIKLYLNEFLSVTDIADKLCVSQNKINYWLSKYRIKKRSISDALYLKKNPKGDPFEYKKPNNKFTWILFGLGIGLYWGEGNKRNKNSIRLGNVDPSLIRAYLSFFKEIYGIGKDKLKFGLQIFSDISPKTAQRFWINELKVKKSQFQKIVITPSRGVGNYKNKNQYGVLTVYFNNTKLKKIFDKLIENFPSV